jgi:hypothetical protein
MAKIKFPKISSVARELRDAKAYIEAPASDEEAGWMDVRLQVMEDGSWGIHTGDASYDLDHRGHWGASSLSRRSNCTEVARDLIEQARESYAMSASDSE